MAYKKNYKICVVGLGYVGIPLLIQLSKHFSCIGYDINKKRINYLSKKHRKIQFVSDLKNLNCNVYIICVPTPVDKFNKPDISALKKASQYISKFLKKNNIVIFESTVNPGTTEEIAENIIEKKSGSSPCYKAKKNNFYLGYSPERVNPGDKKNTLKNITKIISANTEKTLTKINYIYKLIVEKTYKVKNIKIAESAKMLENIQRDTNIALVNQAQMIFDKINIDTIEVIKAAKTKWNFAPFYPGLVGGHCVSVDPYYMSDLAKKLKVDKKIILAGRNTNNYMPEYYSDTISKNLINKKKNEILVMGFSFKENTDDIRNTKVADLVYFLNKKNKICNVEIFDPSVDHTEVKKLYNFKLIKKIKKKYDGIVIAVRHNNFKRLGLKKIKSYLKKDGMIFDIKYTFGKLIMKK